MCIARSGGEGMSLAQGHRSALRARPAPQPSSRPPLAVPHWRLPEFPGQMDARPWSDRPQGASLLSTPRSSHPIQGLMPSPADKLPSCSELFPLSCFLAPHRQAYFF